MLGDNQTPYLHLGLGTDAVRNRNWAVLDRRLYDIARGVLANIPAGGDLAGFYPDPTIRDAAVTLPKIAVNNTGPLTPGEVLTIDPTGVMVWQLPGSGLPTGPAGGSLSGFYPNPVIAAGVVGPVQLTPAVTNVLPPTPALPADYSKQLIVSPSTGLPVWITPPSTAPSGPAGGDLSGTYPNPSLSTIQSAKVVLAGRGSFFSGPGGATVGINSANHDVSFVTTLPSWEVAFSNDLGLDAAQVRRRAANAGSNAYANLLQVNPDGTIRVTTDPINALDLATRQFVLSQVGGGGPPTGAAGGDLLGSTYPNPLVAAGVITRAKTAADLWLSPIPTGADVGKHLAVGAGPALTWQAVTSGSDGSVGTQTLYTTSTVLTTANQDSLINANAADVQLTLPAFSTALSGKVFRITRVDAQAARQATIMPAGADTIDGVNTFITLAVNESITLMACGTVANARNWVRLANTPWRTIQAGQVLTPLDPSKIIVSQSAGGAFTWGARTVKARLGAALVADPSSSLALSLNIGYPFNTNPDNTVEASWMLRLQGTSDRFDVLRAPATSGIPVFASLLGLDANGLLSIPALSGATGNGDALVFGSRTPKGRLNANLPAAGADAVRWTLNRNNAATAAADDPTLSTWEICLRTSLLGDDLRVLRSPPNNFTQAAPFYIQGSDGKTYCTLADASVTRVMMGQHASWRSQISVAMPISFSIPATSTWTQIAVTGPVTTQTGYCIVLCNPGIVSVFGGATTAYLQLKMDSVLIATHKIASSVSQAMPGIVGSVFATAGSHTFSLWGWLSSGGMSTAADNQGGMFVVELC